MSDIYLQITETPTVVTLSAPVVSGALSSTVTVANVVTVALDSNSLSALENVTVTVGAAITGTVTVSSMPAVSGSVTLGAGTAEIGTVKPAKNQSGNAQFLSVDDGSGKLFTSTLLTAGTAQIGSVTASINGTVPISISSVTIGNTVTIAGTVTANPTGTQTIAGTVTISNFPSTQLVEVDGGTIAVQNFPETQPVSLTTLPALVAGTAQIGSVTASISNSVTIGSLPAISGTVTANTFALQGTAVTTSNFTSTTASTVLAGFNATREVLSIFNEGAGNLFVCPGALCTTTAYQVRLSAGDYYEVPNHQTTITHSAVFATAGTARVCQVS